MIEFKNSLPIDEILPKIKSDLADHPNMIVIAPPGTGKTTRIPLSLLSDPWAKEGKIILLEPRRLAAKTAAQRMASTLSEQVGETVGYRIRYEACVSKNTRIEVVTEGILLRQILADPTLEGVSALIFDEAHERSLDCDLALAFAIEAQTAFRPDLRLIVMSATLNASVYKDILDARIVETSAPMFPVETRYRPFSGGREKLVGAIAQEIEEAVRTESGSLLCFLPGEGEITAVHQRLQHLSCETLILCPLYGRLDKKEQDRAIRPAAKGVRKIVLATSIAQTSLTIDGIRIVIDSGLIRRPEWDGNSGMTRLRTRWASKATLEQRKGRAGRLEPGIAIRLWAKDAEGAFDAHDEPEILNADLCGMLVSASSWGARIKELKLPDRPPPKAVRQARELLTMLGIFIEGDRLTALGENAAKLPVHPRLSAMICQAPMPQREKASLLAAFLSEFQSSGPPQDIEIPFEKFERSKAQRDILSRKMAAKWSQSAAHFPSSAERPAHTISGLLSLGFPDRIGVNRDGRGRFHLTGGQGADLPQDHKIAREKFIVAPLLRRPERSSASSSVQLAAPIGIEEIEALFADQFRIVNHVRYDEKLDRVVSDDETKLHAMRLNTSRNPSTPQDAIAKVLLGVLKKRGFSKLGPLPGFTQLRSRIEFGKDICEISNLPQTSEDALLSNAPEWLLPSLFDHISLATITDEVLEKALRQSLPYDCTNELDALLPSHFKTPMGQNRPITYDKSVPCAIIQCRPQHLYGMTTHPGVAARRIPITFELLSPADRPIQKTSDIPSFWKNGWAELRKEMKARYPKHDWPEDPSQATTSRHHQKTKQKR